MEWHYPDFTPDEMRCKASGLLIFHHGFMEELQALRTEFGRSMAVNSGCRSAAHNAAIGGHKRSLHIADTPQHPGQEGTLAVDIATPDGAYRGALFAMAWRYGFSIGWGKGFLHLDRRDFIGLKQTSFEY